MIPTCHIRSGATVGLIFSSLCKCSVSVQRGAPSQSPEKEVVADGKVPCPPPHRFNWKAMPAAVSSIRIQPAIAEPEKGILNLEFGQQIGASPLLTEHDFLLHFQRTDGDHANEGSSSSSPAAEPGKSMSFLPPPQPSSKPPASTGWERCCRPSGNSLPASSMIY